MKKCPFCKAEIEDNARFCLYCMKTLGEKSLIPAAPVKSKRWLPVALGVMALLVLCLLLFSCMGAKTPQSDLGKEDVLREPLPSELTEEPENVQTLEPDVSTEEIDAVPPEGNTSEPSTSVQQEETFPSATESPEATSPTSVTKPTTAPPEGTTSSVTEKPEATSPTTPTVTTTQPKETEPEAVVHPTAPCSHSYTLTMTNPATCTAEGSNTYACSQCGNSYRQPIAATGHQYSEATCLLPKTCTDCGVRQGNALGHSYQDGQCIRCTSSNPAYTEAVYLYSPALAFDSQSGNYVDSKTEIVITGVKIPTSDGIYRIPSTIDGKKVVSIKEFAFSDVGSNARQVYLSSNIESIWGLAFHGCPLTDIYFAHNIEIGGNAFPDSNGILTIHCPKNCYGQSFSKYSNVAREYGAVWEEWNG